MVEAPNLLGVHPTSIMSYDVVMSWLRLQTCLECIPHPCHMYTQCFSTLICCGWTYGCTLTLLRLCRVGVDFWKIELSPSPSDVVMSWLICVSQIHVIRIHSVSKPQYAVDGHMGVPLHCYVCAGQGQGWMLGKLS